MKMKKLTLVAIISLIAVVGVSAVDYYVGMRGNFNISAGSKEGPLFTDDGQDDYIDKVHPLVGGGFGIYANFGLVPLGNVGKFGLQPELNFNFHNGIKIDYDIAGQSATQKAFDHTFDIALLAMFKFDCTKKVQFNVGVGPYLGIPMYGEMETESSKKGYTVTKTYKVNGKEDDGVTVSFDGIQFGLAFDAGVGFKVGPGNIVVDLRYMLDLMKTDIEIKTSDGTDTKGAMTRRSLNIGVGYEFKF